METEGLKGFIYKIQNIKTGECYIGKTTYLYPEKRWHQHICNARNGVGKNGLYPAMRKYGVDSFEFTVLAPVYEPNSLELIQKEYIKKYGSYYHGYNQSRGGEGCHYSCTDESNLMFLRDSYEKGNSIAQISKDTGFDKGFISQFLKRHGIEIKTSGYIAVKHTGKKVAIFNKKHELLAIYPSLGEAAKHFEHKGVVASHISEVCYGKRKNVNGYICEFTNEDCYNENYIIPENPEYKNSQNAKKEVIMCNESGVEIMRFPSGCAVGRYFKMEKPGQATTCIKRAWERNGTWRGYKWKYAKG